MTDGSFNSDSFDPKDLTAEPEEVEHLQHFLQAAMQIELTTIPLYLTAMFSIRPGSNDESLFVLRSVVLEEMLHMTLAANLINAIGGQPKLNSSENIPHYPAKAPYSSPEVAPFPLRYFSEEALDMFIAIESPPYGKPSWDTTGWHTIGQFYGIIDKGLRHLVHRHGEKAVFKGDRQRQVGPEDFYNSGGEVIPVTDLTSARKAIEVIVEEGEGMNESIFTGDDRLFDQEHQEAHYFRFKEIRHARRYGPHDTPSDNPSGPPMEVDWKAAYPFQVDAKDYDGSNPKMASAKKRVDEFNAIYARLLTHLHKAFNGKPATMKTAIPEMLAMKYKADEICRTPHPLSQGQYLYPTFEVTTQSLNQALATSPS